MGHFAFQKERIFLFPGGKLHRHGKAPVAADLYRIGAFDLLAGVQKGSARIFLIRQHIAPHLHPRKAVLRVRVGRQSFQIRLKAPDIPFVGFNLLGKVLEQLILQPELLALVVGLHQLQPGYLHVQIHALLDAGVPGAQGLDLSKGQRGFVHIVAGTHRGFAGHDL